MVRYMNTVPVDFFVKIAKVVDYISRGYEIRAREVFNGMKKTYSRKVQPDRELQNAIEIWVLLDEYLNAHVLDDFSAKKEFLLSAYEDFIEDSKGPLDKKRPSS